MIKHALVNVIQNSIHALSLTDNPKIHITTFCHQNNICIQIEDNGCGIPMEYQYEIFIPSFTLKGGMDVTGSYNNGIKGTGYGMANVRKYIEQHKEEIIVESEVGRGTKITISIPVILKDLTREEKTVLQAERVHYEKYILLVEDEIPISDIQYRVLTNHPCNHKVDTATSGQVAMDLFDRNEYDLISLDYMLSENINGMDVYNHIRAKNKDIPILFNTIYIREFTISKID